MTDTLSSWERLTSFATLGSRRAPMSESLAWPDPSLCAASENVPSEIALLRVAAATRLWNEAGARSSVNEPSVTKDPNPRCIASNPVSEPAAWRLARMIGGEHREFIEEWFAHAAGAGRSLAPQWLPIVLDGVHRNIRDRYASVLGPAAAWLAGYNPAWSVVPAVLEPSKQRWLEGTLDERRGELIALRRIDPSRAIEWLQATWSEDPAQAREVFLKSLQAGLSMADEPFLENALDDTRKGVRQAAIELLAQLPDSRHAERSRARAEPLLVLEEQKGLLAKLRNRKLIIELPSAPDKAAQRDGIESKVPAQRKIGERAFWLTQMVSFVRPRHWLERFNINAKSFVDAVMATEFAQDLLPALTEAATREAEPEFLAEIRRIVTVFRELRDGKTEDGKSKLKTPTGTLSTAEAISVVSSGLALAGHFGDGTLRATDVASGLIGAIVKDPVQDIVVWREYLETVVKERDGWKDLYRACRELL